MPKVKNSIKNDLTLTFPPALTVDDLLDKLRKNNPSKAGKIPNCFLIYRILWVELLKKECTKLNLPEISEFVSTKWKAEKSEVREYYRRLSAQAKERYRELNKSRIFIYHNKCDNTENDNVPNLQSSSTTNNSKSEITSSISIPFDVNSFNSPIQQNQQQIQQSQHQQQLNISQFNPNFTYDLYSSFDTLPITNDLNVYQNCNLKDTIIGTFNSLIETINNFKTFNPEQSGNRNIEKFLVNLKSIINECKLYANFCAIREKMNELEIVTSGPIVKDNPQYSFDLTRGIQGIHEVPQDYIFNNESESFDLFTHINSPPIVNPNYLADNTAFSQFNNNYYLLERNRELEEKARCIQELLKAMRVLIFGNK